MGGFTAPLVADRIPVALIVLVTAMIPEPGETGGDWWGHVGCAEAIAAQGLPDDSEQTLFLHDVPPAVLAASDPPRDQSGRVMEDPWPLAAWPDVPTRFLLCMDDRFFPPEWMRGIVRDRLGIEPDEVPGGHCAFLSQPGPLAAGHPAGLVGALTEHGTRLGAGGTAPVACGAWQLSRARPPSTSSRAAGR